MPKKPQRTDPIADTFEGETYWPAGHETWTHADYVAHARAMQEADAAYIPTAEELEEAAHFAAKQASASGWNQRDPNAD